jgi:hypothetical protein
MRGSGDDLENYFYLLCECEEAVERRAFGRAISAAEARRWGYSGPGPFRLALRVLAMGGKSSPDIAQAMHETLLQRHGCLDPEHKLVYVLPLPTGNMMEGVYLDDHIALGIVPWEKVRSPSGPDTEVIKQKPSCICHGRLGAVGG